MHEPQRMRAVQDAVIPILARLIRDHPGTISLGQGVVGYPPPPEVVQAMRACGGDSASDYWYGPVEGEPALVDAIAEKLARDNGFTIGRASRIVVTAGGNMAFMNAVLAVTDPGDEVVLQAPYYFNHEMAVTIAGCRPVAVATDERYQLRPEAIQAAIGPRTRAVVTISPNNPSGQVYPERVLREVNAICARAGVYHIHDEAYEYFTYGRTEHFSPASIPGASAHTISLYSFSKSYALASARVGYMVIPATLFDAVNKVQDTNLICATRSSQQAALAALRVGPQYCRQHVRDLEPVRRHVFDCFNSIADICTVPEPDGAFYCLARVHVDMDPMALVRRLVAEHRVAAVPGTTFGLTGGCYLRVSYGALAAHTVEEGMERLVKGIGKIAEEMTEIRRRR